MDLFIQVVKGLANPRTPAKIEALLDAGILVVRHKMANNLFVAKPQDERHKSPHYRYYYFGVLYTLWLFRCISECLKSDYFNGYIYGLLCCSWWSGFYLKTEVWLTFYFKTFFTNPS